MVDGQIDDIDERDEASTWAQGALGAKNNLRNLDARVVEAAFGIVPLHTAIRSITITVQNQTK
jgi:hypothetical protein